MKKEKGKKFLDTELIILMISIVYALVFLVNTWDLRFEASIMPRIVATAIIFFCIYIFAGKLVNFRASQISAKSADQSKKGSGVRGQGVSQRLLPWWVTYASMIAYFLLIWLIGILPATLIYTISIPLVMHYQRWKLAAIVGICLSLAMYYAFGSFLSIAMPGGMLFDM